MKQSSTISDMNIEDEAYSDQIIKLPFSFSRQHKVCLDNNTLFFKDAINIAALAEIQRSLDYEPSIKILNEQEFDSFLQKLHESDVSGAMHNIDGMEEVLDLNTIANELSEPEDILEHENDAPVIKLLNALMTEAIRHQASDIHIEQYEGRLRIRFRIDGALREILEPDVKVAPLIISRIKVMAKLDIAEKRLPQDGRISIKVGGRPVDVRISTIPTGNHLEKVVMRLLNKEQGRLNLDYLGMPDNVYSSLKKVIAKPHGIILVTGPTGSGKTTTLYAVLSELNDKENNITTVEDPVEYYIDGINQSQVNSKVGMSFAFGLRSILRQDPDIIMIGEIRDKETAQIAIQASLTGHLVFSTLHTNTAVGAITRLLDMEVEPFLLSSSLMGILAQRLVRTLCHCKTAFVTNDSINKILRINETRTIFVANGCPECNHSGYQGRKGIFDLLIVDNVIRNMIHQSSQESEIKNYASKFSKGLVQMGIDLVLAGETSLDEIIRVTGNFEDE